MSNELTKLVWDSRLADVFDPRTSPGHVNRREAALDPAAGQLTPVLKVWDGTSNLAVKILRKRPFSFELKGPLVIKRS